MARTTDSLVREIIDSRSELAMQPFIDTASNLVDRVIRGDEDGEVDDKTAELIERWLSAHFYEHHHSQAKEKRTGSASAVLQGETAMVLLSSKWGHTACILDPTGQLAVWSREVKDGTSGRVGVTWAGTAEDSPRPDEHLGRGYWN